ncbi:MAG: hypothetical protein AB8G05_03200 [Oligoflexales bacterium]
MRVHIFLISCLLAFTEGANAGLLFSASAHWGVFAFRPLSEQDSSPNYYGLGPGGVIGYHFSKLLTLLSMLTTPQDKEVRQMLKTKMQVLFNMACS